MSLGLTQCVWEEEQLVIIAWQMCVSLCGGCPANAASGSPQRHNVFDSSAPSAGQSCRTNGKRTRWASSRRIWDHKVLMSITKALHQDLETDSCLL